MHIDIIKNIHSHLNRNERDEKPFPLTKSKYICAMYDMNEREIK